MIVTDAHVLATALSDDGRDGNRARGRLRDETLAAPEVVDLEVTTVLRRLVLRGGLSVLRAERALVELARLPMERAPHRPLLSRCWRLRERVSSYDAAYVALAESLGVVLVTADARLSRAPGLLCAVELLGPSPEAGG